MQLLWMLDAVGCVLIYSKGLQFMYLQQNPCVFVIYTHSCWDCILASMSQALSLQRHDNSWQAVPFLTAVSIPCFNNFKLLLTSTLWILFGDRWLQAPRINPVFFGLEAIYLVKTMFFSRYSLEPAHFINSISHVRTLGAGKRKAQCQAETHMFLRPLIVLGSYYSSAECRFVVHDLIWLVVWNMLIFHILGGNNTPN